MLIGREFSASALPCSRWLLGEGARSNLRKSRARRGRRLLLWSSPRAMCVCMRGHKLTRLPLPTRRQRLCVGMSAGREGGGWRRLGHGCIRSRGLRSCMHYGLYSDP